MYYSKNILDVIFLISKVCIIIHLSHAKKYDESLSISNMMSNKGLDPTSKNVWLLVTFRTPRLAFTEGVMT